LQQHDNPWSIAKGERSRWAQGLDLEKVDQKKSSTLLFAGCSADRDEGKSTAVSLARLMKQAGEDFAILGDEEKCCGLHASDLGFRDEYYRLVQANTSTVRKAGVKRIITACGSCQRAWQKYPAQEMEGIEVLHGVDYLARLFAQGRLKFGKTINKKVTYHDPCHLGRGCGVYDSPRKILGSVPGVKLVEMPRNKRWAWCCGGGGGVPEAFPDMSQWSAGDRLREARESGADLLVTTSALCLRSFAQSQSDRPKVQDLFEFICQAV
jgi:Fe-S oxidoreductase